MTKATTELVKQVATLTAETARIAAVSQINLRPVGRGVRWVHTPVSYTHLTLPTTPYV